MKFVDSYQFPTAIPEASLAKKTKDLERRLSTSGKEERIQAYSSRQISGFGGAHEEGNNATQYG